MRKFCSTCGGQLELSKRFCTECGAVNPFFVSAFSLLGDQSGELERLRIEKERIERELQEKEQAHAEFLKQEQLKKQLEELERQKRENAERERLERERIEEELKKEIARVKEESESYKKKTIDLLQEIQVQLQQKIEEEKKTIVEPVYTPPPATSIATVSAEELNPSKASTTTDAENKQAPEKQPKLRLMWTVVPVVVVLILFVWAYRHIYTGTTSKSVPTPGTPQLSSADSEPLDTAETTLMSKAAIDSLPRDIVDNTPSTKVTTTATPPAPKRSTADAVVRPVPKADFNLTTFRVKADLIGKPLSGCGIVVQKLSEINRIRNLVLVEKMPSGYLKYKFEVRVVQANELYTATPYIYYTSTGRFLKIDGTNCE